LKPFARSHFERHRGLSPKDIMSISRVGTNQAQHIAPTPSPKSVASADQSSGVQPDQSIERLQRLLQQIEGAANTRAIPAHQSW
jgi:hypothetical protein